MQSSESTVRLAVRELASLEIQAVDAQRFADELGARRSVRDYSARPVPRAVIEACIRAAGSAPSGANQQPWHFVAVANAEVKQKIRLAAEA